MNSALNSFPSTYEAFTTSRLMRVFVEGHSRLCAATENMSSAHLKARPIPERWSTQEIVFHVVDSEIMAAARIRLAAAASGTVVPGYDQDRWAAAFWYNDEAESEMRRSLSLFDSLRRHSARVLSRVTDAEWRGNNVIHPDFGAITLRQLLELYTDHVERHIDQILARRELLGIAIPFMPLLPIRLY